MAAAQTVSILVDDREPDGAVLAALRQRPEVEVQVVRLAVGDYRVDEALLFERKTLPDLAGSIQDGRLFAQALRLVRAPLPAALILEGTTRDLAGCGMRREAIQGALVTMTLFMGLPLLRALDPTETAALMVTAARQGRAVASGALPRPGRRPRGKARVQNRILQGLPGVGPERARRLLERFGTVEAVMAAPAAELMAVAGIGSATAHLIRWAVGEDAPDYAQTDGPGGWWPL